MVRMYDIEDIKGTIEQVLANPAMTPTEMMKQFMSALEENVPFYAYNTEKYSLNLCNPQERHSLNKSNEPAQQPITLQQMLKACLIENILTAYSHNKYTDVIYLGDVLAENGPLGVKYGVYREDYATRRPNSKVFCGIEFDQMIKMTEDIKANASILAEMFVQDIMDPECNSQFMQKSMANAIKNAYESRSAINQDREK